MREEIRKTKQLTEKPFGVNLIPTAENDIWTPAILPVIKEEGVKVVVYTGYGDGSLKPALFDELKAAGSPLSIVTSTRRRRTAAARSRPERILLSPPALTKAARCRVPPSGPSPSSR